MKHLFVINPIAGGKLSDYQKIKYDIEDYMQKSGETYEVYVTITPMDAAEKVKREALNGEELRVYACGGDGTLNECIHGAAGFKNAAVTHYPCGTGNDFVRMFGDDSKLFGDLDALTHGDVEPMDLIDVNGRKSLNICSVGIDARIGMDVHKYSHLPIIGGAGGYMVSLVVNFMKGLTSKFTVTTDEGTESGKYTLICVCNGRYYGGGFNPSPESIPDDGELEMLLVGKVSLFKAVVLLGDYKKGLWKKHPDIIKHISGRHIKIESSKEFCVNVDGERLDTSCAVMKLIPHGVNFIYPRGCRRLSEKAELIEAV